MAGINGGKMKPIDRSKNGVGYMGICHSDNPVVNCLRCGILCKHIGKRAIDLI